jgi:predicted metal-binding membrane protein
MRGSLLEMRAPSTRLPLAHVAVREESDRDWVLRVVLPVALLALAGAGWWWSVRTADDMTGGDMGAMGMSGTMSFGAFVVAWVAMMAAMMLPAVLPVVRLYARAAAQDRAAPLPFFVAGYVAVWSLIALPASLGWRALEMPLAEARTWVGVLAGASLIGAALWQLSPLKAACLRHCRSPMGFFLRFGGRVSRPTGALRMGMAHGLFCLGCCWALFAVLVVVGTMNLLWMAVIAAFVLLEKNGPQGELIARGGALVCGALGIALLVDPSMLTHLT